MISGHDAARVETLEIETKPVKEAKTLDGTGKQGKSQKSGGLGLQQSAERRRLCSVSLVGAINVDEAG